MIGVSMFPQAVDLAIIALTIVIVVWRAVLLAVHGPLRGPRWQGFNYATAGALMIFTVVALGRIADLLD